VLEAEVAGWRQLSIHESSPGGMASDWIRARAPGYTSSQFLPDVPPGSEAGGVRCEDLEALSFPDETFDVFVTQDVSSTSSTPPQRSPRSPGC
jgi:hypothetical protein